MIQIAPLLQTLMVSERVRDDNTAWSIHTNKIAAVRGTVQHNDESTNVFRS